MHKVYFKKLKEEAILPTFGHDDISNAGIDLYSYYFFTIEAHESAIVHTGIACEFKLVSETKIVSVWPDQDIDVVEMVNDWPKYWKPYFQIKGRSGLAFKHGIEVTNAGVIDEGYRGELIIKLYNHSDQYYSVDKGERIAQIIPMLIPRVEIEIVSSLSESKRGEKGFGSSGQ